MIPRAERSLAHQLSARKCLCRCHGASPGAWVWIFQVPDTLRKWRYCHPFHRTASDTDNGTLMPGKLPFSSNRETEEKSPAQKRNHTIELILEGRYNFVKYTTLVRTGCSEKYQVTLYSIALATCCGVFWISLKCSHPGGVWKYI